MNGSFTGEESGNPATVHLAAGKVVELNEAIITDYDVLR
jgi:hypothetical protein